jgi:hypothetical protein
MPKPSAVHRQPKVRNPSNDGRRVIDLVRRNGSSWRREGVRCPVRACFLVLQPHLVILELLSLAVALSCTFLVVMAPA